MELFIIAGIIGTPEIIAIAVVALIFFGGKKIPELMKGLGKGMKEFKKATNEDDSSDDKPSSTKKED